MLPNSFNGVASIHNYNTRFASTFSYYIEAVKINYGKLNIRFAAKYWNSLGESIKLKSFNSFKVKLIENIILNTYNN